MKQPKLFSKGYANFYICTYARICLYKLVDKCTKVSWLIFPTPTLSYYTLYLAQRLKMYHLLQTFHFKIQMCLFLESDWLSPQTLSNWESNLVV